MATQLITRTFPPGPELTPAPREGDVDLPTLVATLNENKRLILFGTAVFFGDGIITPAISVLSAVEGLEVAAPGLEPFVVPVTLVVLTALFIVQRRGTARVGAAFGPVMAVWFVVLAALGLVLYTYFHPGVRRARAAESDA